MNVLLISITFSPTNSNAEIAILKMWDMAKGNQGGRGLASFVETISLQRYSEICTDEQFYILNFEKVHSLL